MFTLWSVRDAHPRWDIRRSVCAKGCCATFEAAFTEGSTSIVVVCYTLGELDTRLTHWEQREESNRESPLRVLRAEGI